MDIDITESVDRYRLALRDIWNFCFWSDPTLREWESVYSFRRIRVPLFKAIVTDRLDMKVELGDSLFGKDFRVVPASGEGTGFPFMQVNLRRPSDPNAGTWDVIKGPILASRVSLSLVDLFDWSPMQYMDLRYFVVLIESLDMQPDHVGQHALVEAVHARVLFREQANPA